MTNEAVRAIGAGIGRRAWKTEKRDCRSEMLDTGFCFYFRYVAIYLSILMYSSVIWICLIQYWLHCDCFEKRGHPCETSFARPLRLSHGLAYGVSAISSTAGERYAANPDLHPESSVLCILVLEA